MNKQRFIAHVCIWIASATLSVFAQDYKLQENVCYRTVCDAYQAERCVLDVYYPTHLQDCPVIIWFHGGGLVGGNKFIPTELKECGYVVVAANYRFMSQVPITECIRDAAAVVNWVVQHASEYGGNAGKIAVAGHSAGGYLTSMIGLDKQWLGEYGLDPDSLMLLAPYSGQAVTHYEQRRLMGMSELIPLVDELAPMHHMRPGLPPMLIISGDRELELFGRYEEQAYFWRMLRLNGNQEVYLYELQGYDHGAMAVPAHHILKQYIGINEKNDHP